jgi:carnosine N-methyltransferase
VGYEKKLHDIESLISANQEICEAIVAHALDVYGIEKEELDNHIGEAKKNKRSADKVSVSQTLKHFVRDWAAEGTHERDDAFPCILSAIDGLQIGHPASTAPVRVLIPGSGLGRLAHEIAKLDGELPNSRSTYSLSWADAEGVQVTK